MLSAGRYRPPQSFALLIWRLLICLPFISLLLIWQLVVTANAARADQSGATIVLIMDDMGNNLALSQRAIELPGAVTYSFLPHSPYSTPLASLAHQARKEVMLHLPMTALHGHKTGPGALTPAMSRSALRRTLAENLRSVPHARGVNNHMGSLMTQLRQPMDWLMIELKQRGLYFVDSRTTVRTVAEQAARQQHIPALRRHVFLDNSRQPAAIARQFERLLAKAKHSGLAVAIAHPYPETLNFLESAIPQLAAQNIRLVPVSSALAPQAGLAVGNTLKQAPKYAAKHARRKIVKLSSKNNIF